MKLIRLLTTLMIPAASLAVAADWPQWRGPGRNALSDETGLLKQWPAGGPPLVWKASGLGGGFSGVSVAGTRLYTMGDGAESSQVLALGLADGQKLWSAKVGKPGGGGGHPGPRCTPSVDGDLVVALGQYGDLVCLEASTGKERWRKNLKDDFGGRMMSGWGYAESPLIDGERVVCTPGGSQGAIVALKKQTGEVLWRSADFTDAAAYSSVIAVAIGGVRQYIQITDASVAGVAVETGALLWKAPRAGKTAVVPTPIYSDNHVYVSSGYGIGCNLFEIGKAGDRFSAREVYANKEMVNHHGGVLLLNGHVYGYSDGKGWVCQEFKTGQTVWSDKSLGKGAVVYADGHLYLRSQDGKGPLALVEATPTGYKEKSRFDQPDRSTKNSWPHPVIAQGRLYVRDQDILLCYDLKAK